MQIHNYKNPMQFQHESGLSCGNWDKCTVVHLRITNPWWMWSHSLEPSNYQKDLGMIVDSKLNFHRHCTSVVSKAIQCLSVIRSFSSLEAHTLLLLYKSLIWMVLEYGNIVWDPRYKFNQLALNKVQWCAIKLVPLLAIQSSIQWKITHVRLTIIIL